MGTRTSSRASHGPGAAGGHRREAAILAAVQGFRRAFTAFNRLLATASGGRVSMADTMALHFVAHVGRTTPGKIGAFTGLTSGSVTSMLDRLERAGFVTRSRSPADRRVVLVHLRPGARRELAAMMLAAHEEAAGLFEGWSVRRIETLTELLDELRHEQERPPRSRGRRPRLVTSSQA